MGSQIKIGRILGVEVGLHYSWFIIAFLITLSLSARFRLEHPDWSPGTVWLSAGLTGLLFFAALLLHELSHAVTARARGVPVAGITLFALGGISRTTREAESAGTEFLIAIVGPLTSLVVGAVCLGLAASFGWSPEQVSARPAAAVLSWLGYINIVLGVFNMIPGFPLDGGRVLRAIAWGITGNAARATRIAARAGQFVAYCLIGYGLLQFFAGAGLGGLWLAFIGWFLLTAASASYARDEAIGLLRGVAAADVMTHECDLVEPRMTIADFVFHHLLRTGRRCFLVGDGGGVKGLLTLADLKAVPREEWDRRTIEEVMRPLQQVRSVSPETPASEVFEAMTQQDINQMPVIDARGVHGVVSRGDLLRLLKAKAELGV
jgi:Zn-dependent protease